MDYIKAADGSLKESPKLIQVRLQAALSPFGTTLEGIPSIRESPIADYVLRGESANLEYEDPRQLLAHLKFLVLRWLKQQLLRPGANLDWKMADPRTIVDAAFGTSKEYGSKDPNPELFSSYLYAPLLVIRAANFPKHLTPQEALAGLLRHREEARTPTVICYPTGVGLFSSEAARNDPSLMAIFGRTPNIELVAAEFRSELKRKPKAAKPEAR